MEEIKLIVIQGPTASGKSEVAVRLAEEVSGEIINADSMQVYRYMDVGTAKPSPEQRKRVPHHLLDIVGPDQPFSAADFRREAEKAIDDIHGRGRRIILVGGTGLYIRVLLKGLADSPGGDETIRNELKEIARNEGNEALHSMLSEVDPGTAEKLHPNDILRVIRALEVYRMAGRPISELRDRHGFRDTGRYNCLHIGLTVPRDELYRKIDDRVDWMMNHGFLEEVQSLLDQGYPPSLKPLRSIGYKEICSYVAGEYSLDEAVRLIKRDTRHYAKRQMTWLRKDIGIKWFEYSSNVAIISSDVIEFYCKGEGYGKGTV